MICKLLCSKNHLEDVKYHCWCCIYSQIKSKLICKVRKIYAECAKSPQLCSKIQQLLAFLKFLDLIGPLCSFFLCSVWVNKQQQQANGKGVGGSWLCMLFPLLPFKKEQSLQCDHFFPKASSWEQTLRGYCCTFRIKKRQIIL